MQITFRLAALIMSLPERPHRRTLQGMMERMNNVEPIDPGLRRLYSHMTDDEVREAQRNLQRYLAVIVKIYDRLKAEGKQWPKP
jgi:hypothetical protein